MGAAMKFMNKIGALILCAVGAPTSVFAQCTDTNVNQTTMAHLRINQSTETAARPTGLAFANVSASGGGKVLGYTRLRLEYIGCPGDPRDYQSERRAGVKRYFMGKHASKLLQLSAHVRPLDVRRSYMLASIKRGSTKQGEEWTTNLDNGSIFLPYFRVDQSSVVNLEANLVSSREYGSSVGEGALNLVGRASDLLSPTTAWINEANKAGFNKAANFIDASINGLLKVSIDETVRKGVRLDPTNGEQTLAVITLSVPRANDAYVSTSAPEVMVGQWRIIAEPIRPSMFADVLMGQPLARNQITAANILNFSVDDGKTLRQMLAGVASVGAARDGLIGARPADIRNRARTLCRVVAIESDRLGLAPVDSGAAVWAYLTDMALGDAMNTAEAGCREVEHYPSS
jgi:hypothetical protein